VRTAVGGVPLSFSSVENGVDGLGINRSVYHVLGAPSQLKRATLRPNQISLVSGHRRSQDLQRGVVFVKNSRFSQSIFKKNSGERNFTVNFKDFFPKGVVRTPTPDPPCLRLWWSLVLVAYSVLISSKG
jgi:hypothetical protein